MIDSRVALSTPKTPLFKISGVYTAKCVKVYDGDTAHFVFIPFPQWEPCRFVCRMNGYNCAEIRSKCMMERAVAQESRDALSAMILNKIVTLRVDKFDKYGRLLVTVYIDNNDINQLMIRGGHAKEYDGKGEKLW